MECQLIPKKDSPRSVFRADVGMFAFYWQWLSLLLCSLRLFWWAFQPGSFVLSSATHIKTSGWLSQACRHSIKSKTPLTGWGLKVGGREAYLHFNVAISQIWLRFDRWSMLQCSDLLELALPTWGEGLYKKNILTCTSFVQCISMVSWCTPLTVRPCGIVKTLKAFACRGVAITGGCRIYVVVTVTLVTLTILFLLKCINE